MKRLVSTILALTMTFMMFSCIMPTFAANQNGEISNGYYYENGSVVKGAGLVLVDGNYYYIGMRGQVFKGTVSVTEAKANGLLPAGTYEFGDDGKMIVQSGGKIINGYYYENNVKVKGAGIVEVDGNLYYIGSKGQVFKGTIFVTEDKTNGFISAGTYVFDENGVIVIQTGAQIIDGYYYLNNERVKGAGIVEVNNNMYYIGSKGQVFKGTIYVTAEKANGLIAAGTYVFDENGVIVIDNGPKIVNGYYYDNNEIVKGAGVVKVDNKLYYIGMRGQVFVGEISVTDAKANGLLSAGKYTFTADGIEVSVDTDTDTVTETETDTENYDDELITTLTCTESEWTKHSLGTVDFTTYTNVRFVMTSTDTQYGFNKFYINDTEYWLGGDMSSLSGTLDGNDSSFRFANVAGQSGVTFAYEGNPTLTVKFYGIKTNTDTESDTDTQTDTETETDTASETDTETTDKIVIYQGTGVTSSDWDGVQITELNGFVPTEGGIFEVTFANSYNGKFKLAANNPTWEEILSGYFYDDCITVYSDTMSFTLSASDAAAFAGKSELWIVASGVTVTKIVYILNANNDTDTDTQTDTDTTTDTNVDTNTDTDTQTETDPETDTEISEGIVLYQGSGIQLSGWEGAEVAELDSNFTAQKGGVLRVSFARGNNPEFKFAANNPTWDEILSAYFNEWDCIYVNNDTMDFTLSSADAQAFVGHSELWAVGDNVTITKVVYIPNENPDTDTDTNTDTDTSTDTNTDTDTSTDVEIVIYNGSAVITDWEQDEIPCTVTNVSEARSGGKLYITATVNSGSTGQVQIGSKYGSDWAWATVIESVDVTGGTVEVTLDASQAYSLQIAREIDLKGNNVTITKVVYKGKYSANNTTGTPFDKHGALSVSGRKLVDKNGNDFQLYGMSTHGIAWHPQFVSLETFKTLCDWGINCVRIAMYTDEYGGYCTYEPNEATLKAKVEDAIRYASELGIYVIVDWHILQDETPLKYKDKALAFFEYISSKYSGYDNILYEICNEPNTSATWYDVKSYANEVIPVIRNNDSNAVILVGTTSWCLDVHLALQSPLNFSNIMYDFHFYANSHKQYYRDRVKSCLDSGLPIFVTEFGTCDATGGGTVNYDEANAWKALIEEYGLSFMCWNLSNQDESSSLVLNSCSKTYGWSDSELSDQGRWIKAWFLEKKGTQ